jgi:heme A synthase
MTLHAAPPSGPLTSPPPSSSDGAQTPSVRRDAKLARVAWGVLGYNLLVILWGAYVRASGSGAGCGDHWPLCNGEVIPRSRTAELVVELTHRVTSGVALIAVVTLFVLALRRAPRGALVRKGAWASLVFIVTEALLGAGLVLFRLVADDASLARGLSMTLHLTNTLLLVASLTLTAHFAGGGERLRLRARDPVTWLLASSVVGVFFVATMGGIAALGDTLFPARTLAEGIALDFSPTAHLFLRLRVFHPMAAAGVGLYILVACALVRYLRPSPAVRRWSRVLAALYVVQFAIGLTNLLLLAPTALQLVHLLFADAVWIALVMLGAHALSEAPRPEPTRAADVPPVAAAVG